MPSALPQKGKGVVFGREAADRIARTVLRSEGQSDDPRSKRRPLNAAPFMTIQPASVTTAIPTGTLGSPSTAGRVTIYRDDGAGGLAAAETGQECHNYHTLTASVPLGTTVSVAWRAGVWWLVNTDCY